jgi:hypothetical protein
MRNICQIVCPIDLSDASRHALDHARVLAQWYAAKITVLHVCNPIVMPPIESVAVGAMSPPVLTEDERGNARQEVREFIGGERGDTSTGGQWPTATAFTSRFFADKAGFAKHGAENPAEEDSGPALCNPESLAEISDGHQVDSVPRAQRPRYLCHGSRRQRDENHL